MLGDVASHPVEGVFASFMYVVLILSAIIGYLLGRADKKVKAPCRSRQEPPIIKRLISYGFSQRSYKWPSEEDDEIEPASEEVPPKEEFSEEPLTGEDIVRDAVSGLKNLSYSARESKLIVKELAEENKYECPEDLIRDVFKHARK
jgi:hypothetical protein